MNNYHLAEVRHQIDEWNADPGVGAIVVTGAGRAFCAGVDIGEWQSQLKQRDAGETVVRDEVFKDEKWIEMIKRSKPLVAAINGFAVGAGLAIILPFDVRIASDQARLSMRFIRAGVIPHEASTFVLPQIVGLTHALDLMLSGRIITAEEAGRIGLVNRVVPHASLLDEAIATAAELAANPTESLRAVKRLVWRNLVIGDVLAAKASEDLEFAAARERPTFREAVLAFREKRDPDFHSN
jgi:2-(1,2-epoxy-1,2-dihydrophenyl)acetyl-CoA isomerase